MNQKQKQSGGIELNAMQQRRQQQKTETTASAEIKLRARPEAAKSRAARCAFQNS
jgi:hypothetical protein